MKILELTLTAKEPLVITSGSAESMAHSCLSYIPGSMLLGAFAGVWVRARPDVHPDSSPEFQSLFLNGDVSWGCAYPLCGPDACVPVPLCYMREKSMAALPVYGQKFSEKEFKEKKFAVFNPLPLAAGEDESESLSAVWRKNFDVGNRVAKFKKLPAAFMEPRTLWRPDIRMVWNTRVALGRKRSALEGRLFGFSALAPGSTFRAEIRVGSKEAENSLAATLADLNEIRVGHARSAGYGLAGLEFAWMEAPPSENFGGEIFDVYLASRYLPNPPWEDPLANFVAKLGEIAGAPATAEKTFLAYEQVEGFDGHWKRPRDSRPGLVQGGVVRIRFAKPVSLPESAALGAAQAEGFGRVLVNPAFLKDVLPKISAASPEKPKKPASAPASLGAPFWRILRARAVERAARRQALLWLENAAWQNFLKDAEMLDQPSASQRANVMTMTRAEFEAMLAKTPGRQWKDAVAFNPFGQNRREHLHEIIRLLLDPQAFASAFPAETGLALPGGAAAQAEIDAHARKSHAIFKRELIRTWSKNARIRQTEGKDQ